MTRETTTLAAVLVLAFLALPAQAVPIPWDGGSTSTNDWMNADNWDPNGVPSSGNSYVIDSTTGGTAVTSTTAFAGDDLRIETGGVLQSRNGSSTASGAVTFAGGTYEQVYNGNVHSLTANGGFVVEADTTTTLYMHSSNGNGYSLTGTLSGTGALTKTGAVELGFNTASPSFTGAVNVNQGAIKPVGTALANAYVTLNSGGTLNLFGANPTLNHLTLNGGTIRHGSNNGQTLTGSIDVQARSFIARAVNNQTTTLNVTLTGSANLVFSNAGYAANVALGSSFDSTGYTGAFEFESGSKLNLAGHDLYLGGLVLDGNAVASGVYDASDWTAYVSANSWASGYLTFGGTTNTMTITTVPEPATLGFLAVGGLAMIGAAARRRRRN